MLGSADGCREPLSQRDGKERVMDSINHAKRFFLRGNQLLARGDCAHAIPEYTQAIQSRPEYYEAYHNRAVARYWQNDFVGAVDGLR